MSRVTPARRVAYEVLRRTFEHGAWTDRALASATRRGHLEGLDPALARRLAYGAVQRRGTSDHLIEELAGRPPDEIDAPALAALRLGIYELLFMDAVPDHAAVDQAVELAKAGGSRGAAGLVNAVLRRAAREGDELLASLDDADPERAALRYSYPRWLARLFWDELGAEGARSLMRAMNEPAEAALRVNTLKADRDSVVAELRAAGVDATVPEAGRPLAPPESILVRGTAGTAVGQLITQGALVPQSRASAAVVGMLDPKPGERVLDLCAGPGVKTTQIAARMGDEGEVVAVELRSGRASELRTLCRRVGAGCVSVEVADATEADLGSGYDRALVDPPCSDLGTLARHPDARWRKSPELIERLIPLQARIAERAIESLRPGGLLVYSTCTISRRENEDQAAALPGVSRERMLSTRPDRDRTDGFFAARLRREG